ncbi:DNA-processing protein DprA [Nocardioides sp. CPCC 205120]|uniref:DNA-processing protein DprA n=1 Tax=Nocardioides sp. CPCC 205120 TaxID=3406462 RepID=UPI003B506CBF
MSVDDAERVARVALSHLAEPGDPRLLRLTRTMGAVALYDALLAERDLDGTLSDVATRLAGVRPERRLEQAHRQGARFVVPGDDEWPAPLDDLADHAALHRRAEVPVGLWVRGPLRLDRTRRSVAVVGSRAATTYGGTVASDLGADLAANGWCTVSGAAFGVDQAAHRGALAAGGDTVAVLACGVDRAYPSAHEALLEMIGDRGAVVSEAPLGGAPTRIRFLARNRLIAALSRGTVVVEAAVRSGALNTAGWAERLNRVVMGVPGPVTSGLSQGVHELIRTRAGLLVTSGADVREVTGDAGDALLPPLREAPRIRDGLTGRQQEVLDAVPVVRGASTQAVARTAGIAVDVTERELRVLRREGLVEEGGTGWRLAQRAIA